MRDVIAINHHRRQRHAGILGHLHSVHGLHEGRLAARLEGFDHLHHQLAPARERVVGLDQVEPGRGGVAAAARLVAHVWRATEARKPAARDRRGMAVAIDLERGADEQVHRVLAGELAEGPIGAHRAVRAGEEDVRASRYVVLHAQFAAEAVHALDPARLDGRDQRGVRVQRPVPADLALEPERFAVGRQDQFDGGRVEADAVV
ncbi:hypothetical protein D3C86_1633630 [compost metagenome]